VSGAEEPEAGARPRPAGEDGARRGRLYLAVGAIAGLAVVLVLLLATLAGVPRGWPARGDRPPSAAAPGEGQTPRSLSPLPAPPADAVPPADPAAAGPALSAEERLLRLEAADAELARQLSTLATALAMPAGAQAAADFELRSLEMLLLSLARRRLERGAPIDDIAPALARRFGARDPEAMDALAAWSRAPVSAAALAERLRALEREAEGAPPPDSGGEKAEGARAVLGTLVRVRRVEGGWPAAERFRAAAVRLAEGDAGRAAAVLDSGPVPPRLRAWLADARRLARADRALERLEVALVSAAPLSSGAG